MPVTSVEVTTISRNGVVCSYFRAVVCNLHVAYTASMFARSFEARSHYVGAVALSLRKRFLRHLMHITALPTFISGLPTSSANSPGAGRKRRSLTIASHIRYLFLTGHVSAACNVHVVSSPTDYATPQSCPSSSLPESSLTGGCNNGQSDSPTYSRHFSFGISFHAMPFTASPTSSASPSGRHLRF